ncbi:MAG TPA: metal ABC transporter permease [Mycobacteriales bacterium]|nr:metal ABC transporter permease [Mycobacteriales bacterium]
MNFWSQALVEAALVGGLCGAVGVHVVLRRLSFFTMAMTHATFPGIVLAALLGVNLYLGGGAFGVLVVLAVAWLANRRGAEATSSVGVVLSAGFALGVVMLSARAGFSRDLSAFLVGSILTVSGADVRVAAAACLVALVTLAALGKELVFGAFDRQGMIAHGYRVLALDLVLLVLVELTVVTAVPAVGTILAVALLVAPAATARLWCGGVAGMTAVAVPVGVATAVVGVLVSEAAGVAAGATVVLVGCVVFAVSLLVAPHGPLRSARSARRRTGRPAPAGGRLAGSLAGYRYRHDGEET